MTKSDLDCYRINYEKESWLKSSRSNYPLLAPYFAVLPAGILDAVEALCKEVERLQKKVKEKK